MDTLHSLFFSSCEKYAENILLQSDHGAEKFSYDDSQYLVEKIIGRLINENIKKGDFVCSVSGQNMESFLIFWATVAVGAVFVPIDPNWSVSLINSVLAEVNPSLVFVDHSQEKVLNQSNKFAVIVYDNHNSFHDNCFSNWINEVENVVVDNANVTADDLAVVLFTSGTTGKPKGVMLSHGALVRSAKSIADFYSFKPDDILFCPGNFCAMSGLRNPAITPLTKGFLTHVYDMGNGASIFHLMNEVSINKCTILSVTPVVIRRLIQEYNRIDKNALKHIRKIICTGSALPKSEIIEFNKMYQIPLLNYYGLTETCGFCIAMPESNGMDNINSIGVEVDANAEIVNDRNEILEYGTEGELRIKSKNLSMGYLNNQELTKMSFRNGCYYTGDLAVKNEKGFIELIGRKRDIYKNAEGNLVYPSIIEAYVLSLSIVSDAAVSVIVKNNGEEFMIAYVIANSTSNEAEFLTNINRNILKEFGRGFEIGVLKLLDELPRNATGKVNKSRLDSAYKSEMGL